MIVVYPLNDVLPHIDSLRCQCGVRIEGKVLIHNAFDGRDRREKHKQFLEESQ